MTFFQLTFLTIQKSKQINESRLFEIDMTRMKKYDHLDVDDKWINKCSFNMFTNINLKLLYVQSNTKIPYLNKYDTNCLKNRAKGFFVSSKEKKLMNAFLRLQQDYANSSSGTFFILKFMPDDIAQLMFDLYEGKNPLAPFQNLTNYDVYQYIPKLDNIKVTKFSKFWNKFNRFKFSIFWGVSFFALYSVGFWLVKKNVLNNDILIEDYPTIKKFMPNALFVNTKKSTFPKLSMEMILYFFLALVLMVVIGKVVYSYCYEEEEDSTKTEKTQDNSKVTNNLSKKNLPLENKISKKFHFDLKTSSVVGYLFKQKIKKN